VNFVLPKGKKLCYISSTAALGEQVMKPLLRKKLSGIRKKPHSDYIFLYGAEMEIWRGQQEGLDVIIVNPGVWSPVPRTGKRPTFRKLLTDTLHPGERSIRR
jgi:hypothetical protein